MADQFFADIEDAIKKKDERGLSSFGLRTLVTYLLTTAHRQGT
jgi:hypothetical protein